MDELVQMLSNGEHNAEVLHSKNASEVKEQVDRKWINMKFTDIGTTITFQLDEARSDYASGDYDNDEGKVKFVGKHTLNYEPVWVVMDFDLATLKGKARLEKRDITLDPTEAEKEAADKKAGKAEAVEA